MGGLVLLMSAAMAQAAQWVPMSLMRGHVGIQIGAQRGAKTAKVTIRFSDSGYRVNWGKVQRRGKAFIADVAAEEWTGGAAQVITYRRNTYRLGALGPGTYRFYLMSRGEVVEEVEFTVPRRR